jgi:hypothetical protein
VESIEYPLNIKSQYDDAKLFSRRKVKTLLSHEISSCGVEGDTTHLRGCLKFAVNQ